MKWPAIVRFDNSDELDAINDESSWQQYAASVSGCCELISSDGTVYSIVSDTKGRNTLQNSGTEISVENAVILAQRHMAAQAHCCVSKFNAATVEEVIAAIILLEQD